MTAESVVADAPSPARGLWDALLSVDPIEELDLAVIVLRGANLLDLALREALEPFEAEMSARPSFDERIRVAADRALLDPAPLDDPRQLRNAIAHQPHLPSTEDTVRAIRAFASAHLKLVGDDDHETWLDAHASRLGSDDSFEGRTLCFEDAVEIANGAVISPVAGHRGLGLVLTSAYVSHALKARMIWHQLDRSEFDALSVWDKLQRAVDEGWLDDVDADFDRAKRARNRFAHDDVSPALEEAPAFNAIWLALAEELRERALDDDVPENLLESAWLRTGRPVRESADDADEFGRSQRRSYERARRSPPAYEPQTPRQLMRQEHFESRAQRDIALAGIVRPSADMGLASLALSAVLFAPWCLLFLLPPAALHVPPPLVPLAQRAAYEVEHWAWLIVGAWYLLGLLPITLWFRNVLLARAKTRRIEENYRRRLDAYASKLSAELVEQFADIRRELDRPATKYDVPWVTGSLVAVLTGIGAVRAPEFLAWVRWCIPPPAPAALTTSEPPPPPAASSAPVKKQLKAPPGVGPAPGERRTPAFKQAEQCRQLLAQGEIDGAEAACRDGLALEPLDWTQGRLAEHLGTIEERRGNLREARTHFEEARRVQPGDARVARSLASIDRQIAAAEVSDAPGDAAVDGGASVPSGIEQRLEATPPR